MKQLSVKENLNLYNWFRPTKDINRLQKDDIFF